MYGREERYIQGFGGETPPRRRREDNIKKNIQEVGGGGRDRTDQIYDRYMWRALVNAVINLRVP